MDYAVILGVGQDGITFAPKSDRARQRTPEGMIFTDRANALDYMRAAEAEGYRFLNARNLDVTRGLVKYGYCVWDRDGQLTQARRTQNWGPLDTDYEAGDSLGVEDGKEGIILEILTGAPAVRAEVGVMFVLEERDHPGAVRGPKITSRKVPSVRSGEWNLAVMSGLITGAVLAFSISRIGPVGLPIVALVWAFFILNRNFCFTWAQKLVATGIALAIGSYGRQILEIWAGLYH
jgi:hypothetical protein